MCVFDKGKKCGILTEKVCENGDCSFFCTKKRLIESRKRADALFVKHTGVPVSGIMEYVKSHAPKEV